MRVRAQLMMVMNLDKCLGCHTCSITCKQAWTNRAGAEYMWFNNVETRPGSGYPRQWEDQDRWRGGWALDRRGRLTLRAGGRAKKLITIFGNLDMPKIDDYYEPWSYDYANLIDAPSVQRSPVISPHSALTGKPIALTWGPNWEDNLAGVLESSDASLALHEDAEDGGSSGLPPTPAERRMLLEYERIFLFYVPRICNHCVNPSCVASCPSGAMYKREEDGVVLVDQDKCRGWRFCVSGCPYKKVYFNHRSGKAEKCLFCYPITENGRPTICSETCVGRLRAIGVVFYDLDAVTEGAETPEAADLVEAQRALLLDPRDRAVREAATRAGIPSTWIEAAARSPAYALAKELRVALPLHPEYRTLPMVWYVPPLSPVLDGLSTGSGSDDPAAVLPAVADLRIPLRYVAGFLSAGALAPVEESVRRLLEMRVFKRRQQLGFSPAKAVGGLGSKAADLERLYRLLGVAAYDERYVIPRARREAAGAAQTQFRDGARTDDGGERSR